MLRALSISLPLWAATPAFGGVPLPPQPLGTSTLTVSYLTTTGAVSFSGDRDYAGVLPPDATALGAAPNIRAFNSVNAFGRRPIVPGAVGASESLITHAFFKIDNGVDYFPDVLPGSAVTVTVEGIVFDVPVAFDPGTVLLHVKWFADQVDQLPMPYIQVDDHYTQTDPFRDFDAFVNAGVFSDFPVPNYVLQGAQVDVLPTSDHGFDLTITFPYELLRNLEELGQAVPPDLPAPGGFLEPFHFHVEYIVTSAGGVPAASHVGLAVLTASLLGGGAVLIRRRCSRSPVPAATR